MRSTAPASGHGQRRPGSSTGNNSVCSATTATGPARIAHFRHGIAGGEQVAGCGESGPALVTGRDRQREVAEPGTEGDSGHDSGTADAELVTSEPSDLGASENLRIHPAGEQLQGEGHRSSPSTRRPSSPRSVAQGTDNHCRADRAVAGVSGGRCERWVRPGAVPPASRRTSDARVAVAPVPGVLDCGSAGAGGLDVFPTGCGRRRCSDLDGRCGVSEAAHPLDHGVWFPT